MQRLALALMVLGLGCTASSDATTAAATVDGTGVEPTSAGASDDADASGSTHGPIGGCEPTDAGVFAAVFEPSCNLPACHGSTQPAVGLDLSEVAALQSALLGVPSICDGSPLVVAGDSGASLLQRKLEGTAGCGDMMPVGAPLDDGLIACVGSWIDGLQSTCETCGGPTCVDVDSDPLHCGGCDTPCPDAAPCVDGACACSDGQRACGSSCVDTTSDPDHCGGCDQPCAMVCLAGECAADCGALTACDGACVDTQGNRDHCGGCDQPCAAGQDCVEGACVCAGEPVSFAATIGPLLVAECTAPGCHSGAVPKAGLDLRAAAAYDDLVGVAASQCGDRLRVAPGDATNSYLMDKLRGVDLCSGTQMPKAGQSLAESDLAAIESWICNGAQDD